MKKLLSIVGISLGFALGPIHCAHVLYGSDPDQRSYVLLQNGNVWHGIARPIGERLEVKLDHGSVVQVDMKQVIHVADSKETLYQNQIRAIKQWGSGEHWHFTQWCIQQDLLDHAIYHYKQLEKKVDHDLKFKQLEMQLREKLLASEPVQRALTEQMQQNAGTPTSTEGVQLASAEMPVNNAKTSLPAAIEKGPKGVSPDRKSLMAIPGYVKKSFQANVAPILVSRCGQAGCHGLPGKSEFHIYQAVGDNAADIAAQNLEQVLRYISPKNPMESVLLSYATNAHGIQKNPRFNPLREDDRFHIERISQWIKSVEFSNSTEATGVVPVAPAVSVTPGVVSPAIAEMVGPELSEGKTRSEKIAHWKQSMPEQDRNAKLSKPAKTSQGPAALTAGEISDLERAIDKLDREHKAKASKDPFDPNVFNSQFGRKK